MTRGYVETSVTKCLILGAAGVGKTHLKHLLLKKNPPKQRTSTGLAEAPIRAMVCVGGKGEDDWFVVGDDHALLNVIGGIINGGVSMAPSLADVARTLPKMAMDSSIAPSDGAFADEDWVNILDVDGNEEGISYIGGTIRRGGLSKTPTLFNAVNTLPAIAITPTGNASVCSPIPAGARVPEDTPQLAQSKITSIEDELVHCINQCSGNSSTGLVIPVIHSNLPLQTTRSCLV